MTTFKFTFIRDGPLFGKVRLDFWTLSVFRFVLDWRLIQDCMFCSGYFLAAQLYIVELFQI